MGLFFLRYRLRLQDILKSISEIEQLTQGMTLRFTDLSATTTRSVKKTEQKQNSYLISESKKNKPPELTKLRGE
jgi:uncharacterized protein with HEPN domain